MTTTHNFKKGITATQAEQAKAEFYIQSNNDFEAARAPYDGKAFKDKRKAMMQQDGPLIDAYTGKEIPKDGRSHLDHIVSAHELHKDAKNHLFMTDQERINMALDDKNLAMTNGSLNQSKGDAKMSEFLDGK